MIGDTSSFVLPGLGRALRPITFVPPTLYVTQQANGGSSLSLNTCMHSLNEGHDGMASCRLINDTSPPPPPPEPFPSSLVLFSCVLFSDCSAFFPAGLVGFKTSGNHLSIGHSTRIIHTRRHLAGVVCSHAYDLKLPCARAPFKLGNLLILPGNGKAFHIDRCWAPKSYII